MPEDLGILSKPGGFGGFGGPGTQNAPSSQNALNSPNAATQNAATQNAAAQNAAAQNAATQGTATQRTATQRTIDAVDADRLMEHVRVLTQTVRSPDSQGEQEAFAFLEEILREGGGCKSARCKAVLPAPAVKVTRYALPAYVSMPTEASLIVIKNASPCLVEENISCTTHAMLPSADLEAELVHIPEANHIRGSHVAGKLVLTESLAMAPIMKAAEEEGAAGVVFIAGSRHFHEMIVSTVWGSPEPKDLNSYLRIPAVTVCHADGERLKAILKTSPRARLHTRVNTGWTSLPVLTADIGPVDKGYILLTGHVDSWHKGAMDNASGNAAALEIARVLAEYNARSDQTGKEEGLRRGVRVVFWSGHSHGRYAGSAAFCDAFYQDIHDNALLHVNADCLGAQGATLLTQGACMAETWGLGNHAVHTVTGQTLEGTRFSRSCDQSFWGTGTPSLFSSVSEQPKPEKEDAASKAFALMFGGSQSGGYGWWWHTEADTLDKLDPAFLRRDTQILLAAILKACTDPILPLDIRAGFNEFATAVRGYATESARYESPKSENPARLDFTPLLQDIEHTENLLRTLDLHAQDEATVMQCNQIDRRNRLIMDLEQQLVPLVYVKGSVYGHDPATRQAPVPLLEETHLLGTENNPHQRNALTIVLQRRLNEIRQRVRHMIRLLAAANESEEGA